MATRGGPMADRYGLFLDPDGDLLETLVAWKRRVADRWPAAAYVTHPPHGTVWVGSLDRPDDARTAVAAAAKRAARDPIEISRTQVFHADPAAGGGHTLVFASPLTPALAALQRSIHDALRPFIRADYPFAGPHWIPHFTVAAVPVERNDPLVAEFLSLDAAALSTRFALSWWRIDGDRHEKVMEL
jgi:2'-5' RNA ligase